ncbi:MAG: TolC family protein [Desulfuromonadaceae bacterium]|nr:TolC family protein [Desulfuromonadaceae bacterium]
MQYCSFHIPARPLIYDKLSISLIGFMTFFLLFSASPPLPGGERKAHASEIRTLTLDQALSIAMEKNRDIEKAKEYAKYVQGKYVEERSAALPQFSLNGSTTISKDESQEIAGFPAQRQFGRTVDLNLSQQLYSWGKVNAAIRAAELGLKTADEQLRLYRQAAYRDVTAAYYDILLAKELHNLSMENQSQKQRHLDEAKRKFSAGVATDYDVLAAEVAADNARPEVIRTGNSIRIARERLRFLLALGVEEVDAIGSLERPSADLSIPFTYEEALLSARKRRPELADLRLRIGIYDELITIANADDKPRLDLRGGAGWHWASLDNPAPKWELNGPAWNVGVYLTFPFFDGLKASGRVAQARSDLRTKQIEEAKLLDAISLEVREAEYALREALEIFQAISGTVKQAERLVLMAEKGYEYGVKIRLEVDDAQLNLLQARSSQASAQRDYRVARVNYEWASGVAGE